MVLAAEVDRQAGGPSTLAESRVIVTISLDATAYTTTQVIATPPTAFYTSPKYAYAVFTGHGVVDFRI
jgi:hypothetical protein